jgi:hypothetical protein
MKFNEPSFFIIYISEQSYCVKLSDITSTILTIDNFVILSILKNVSYTIFKFFGALLPISIKIFDMLFIY